MGKKKLIESSKNKIAWFNYQTHKFQFPMPMEEVECGAYALHAITKIPYNDILKFNKSKDGHWSTKTMLKFLKKHKYDVAPITVKNTVNCYSVSNFYKPLLRHNNVILIDQKCYVEENSWLVLYKGFTMHSGEIDKLNGLEFINYPIEQAYMIWHKDWGDKNDTLPKMQ